MDAFTPQMASCAPWSRLVVTTAISSLQPTPPLVKFGLPMIEAGELENARGAASSYVESLLKQDERIDTVLLGCTHYALIEYLIRDLVPPHIQLVSQGTIDALKLVDYLRRHPEMEIRLDRSGTQKFLTTQYSVRIQRLGTQFFGGPIVMEIVSLG